MATIDRIAIGIIIIPPFIMISINLVTSGAGCVGRAGADAIVLFSVSIVWVMFKKIVVILNCLCYKLQNEISFKNYSLYRPSN
jgi:hypothetical protein